MKTVLIVTTFLVAVLAIGLIGINNNYNYNTNNIPDVFAQENTVSIVTGSSNPIAIEFCFPKESTVSPGTTVTWTNDDTIIHRVVERSPQSGGAIPAFDSSTIASGSTWDNTFDTAEEFTYYCNLHPFMTDKVTVS